VPIARQRIVLPKSSWRLALTALATGDLWEGDEVERLEKAFAAAIGVPAAVAVPSARAGLSFILESMDLEPGAEIICSAFGYPVVPHLVATKGYTLGFADCELETLGMDPEALSRAFAEGDPKAVIVTHLYGIPARIREIAEVVKAHDAYLIEDCAHCFSAAVGGQKAGSFGDFGYFSFETSKMINTMGGGMLTVRDPEMAEKIRERARQEPQRDFGWLAKRLGKTTFEATVTQPLVFGAGVYPALRLATKGTEEDDRFASGYQADEISMKGRMGRYTNYQARLGLQQIEAIESLIERRVANAERLIGQLSDRVHFQQPVGADTRADYMLVTALFPRMPEMAQELLQRGVDTKHQYMRDCADLLEGAGEFPNAARAEREALHLPAYPQLSTAQIDSIAEKVKEALNALGTDSGTA
jgi:dTDP-4-amino-4,6-dideoxygalactose transaminase